MICPACGEKDNKETAKFCQECGKPLKNDSAQGDKVQVRDAAESSENVAEELSSDSKSLREGKTEAKEGNSEKPDQNDEQNRSTEISVASNDGDGKCVKEEGKKYSSSLSIKLETPENIQTVQPDAAGEQNIANQDAKNKEPKSSGFSCQPENNETTGNDGKRKKILGEENLSTSSNGDAADPKKFKQEDDLSNNQHSFIDENEEKSGVKKNDGERQQGKNGDAEEIQHPSLKQVEPHKGVTVVFQAFLSPVFAGKNDDNNVFIRAEGNDLGNWNLNCVDLYPVGCREKTTDEDMLLYEGKITLSVNRAKNGISYKYILVNEGEPVYEHLPEFPRQHYNGNVNRCLKIPGEYLKANATWIQSDGVLHCPLRSMWEYVKSYFTSDQPTKERKNALLQLLPAWEGFVTGKQCEEMSPSKALEKLKNVVLCLTEVWIEEHGERRREKPKISLPKILLEYLEPRLSTMETDEKWKSHTQRLIAALVICSIFKKYNIQASQSVNAALLKCLALKGDIENRECKDYQQIVQEFPDHPKKIRRELADGIIFVSNQLIEQQHDKCVPYWLCALPLLHFLRGESSPFENPESSGSRKHLACLGARGLSVPVFTQKNKKHSFLVDIWNLVKGLFSVDPLLKETFLLILPLSDLEKMSSMRDIFTVDDLCNALIHLLQERQKHRNYEERELDSVLEIIRSLGLLMKTSSGEKSDPISGLSESTTEIAIDVLKEILKLKEVNIWKSSDLICHSVSFVLATLRRLDLVDGDRRKNRTSQQLNGVLKELQIHLQANSKRPISESYKQGKVDTELKVWSHLLSIADEFQGFEMYTDAILQMFRDRVKKAGKKCIIEIFCKVKMDSYHEIVKEGLNNLAAESVETIIREGQTVDFSYEQLSHGRNRQYGELLSQSLIITWENIADQQKVKKLLTWGPMSWYMTMFGETSKYAKVLPTEARAVLKSLQMLIRELGENVITGSIDIRTVKLLKQHRKRFVELWREATVSMQPSSKVEASSSINTLEHSLELRLEELEEFRTEQEQLENFLRMCEFIQPVNTGRLRKRVQTDVTSLKMNELCEVRPLDSAVVVTFFSDFSKVREVMKDLNLVKASHSSVFVEIWKQLGKKAQNKRELEKTHSQLSLSEVVEQVLCPAYEQWADLVESVSRGSIILRDVERHFAKFEVHRLKSELELLLRFSRQNGSPEVDEKVSQRMEEMKIYRQLQGCSSAAEEIFNFKNEMSIEGDFRVVEGLLGQMTPEFKSKSLNSMDKQYLRVGQSLSHLSAKEVECLKTLAECKELIQWLQSTIKSTKELKVLVDLALISAAESDIETDRISHLHTSCLGFSSLIFNLEIGKNPNVGFDQLMEACQPVWKAIETDVNLAEKLKLTSTHLKWFKDIELSFGSVAKTSLLQAEAINARGVYTVGRLNADDDISEDFSEKSVLKLTVAPENETEEREEKVYTVDELNDLQSKLMLIAGKASQGKEEVETFVRNLEAAVRLANVYVNLYKSGCVYHLNWSQEFECQKDKVEGQQPVNLEISDISSKMEDCLEKWKQKVNNARVEFPELNHFTTQQLMTLRKEIAKTCHRHSFVTDNVHVLALLESVLPDVDSESLKSAIMKAFKGTFLLEETARVCLAKGEEEVSSGSLSDDNRGAILNQLANLLPTQKGLRIATSSSKCTATKSRVEELVHSVESNGFSEKVALAGIVSCGESVDEDDLVVWCMDNHDNDEAIEELYQTAVQQDILLKTQNDPMKVAASSKGLPKETSLLCEDTASDDEGCEEDQSIGTFLTMKQLGTILRGLSIKGRRSDSRNFPSFLKKGRPNMMLVPADDVLAIVLALFMQGENESLPSSEEVLICTESTSLEEVENLYRRATQDAQGGFYCLVNADLLDYKVSDRAVELLETHTQGLAGKACEDFGLVFICSRENDNARIVAALDQFKVAAPACPLPDEIRGYLKRQLRARSVQNGFFGKTKVSWKAAGELEKERLSLRVVTSSRGGLGKSLVAQRLSEKLENLMNNSIIASSYREKGQEIPLSVTVPIHGNRVDTTAVLDLLLPHTVSSDLPVSRIFHVDVSPSVKEGLDTFLFNLVILGLLCDSKGRVWRKRSSDLYIIEIPGEHLTGLERGNEETSGPASMFSAENRVEFLHFLPTTKCISPKEVEKVLQSRSETEPTTPLLDEKELRSDHFQRVFQYLDHVSKGKSLDKFKFRRGKLAGDKLTCLSLLLEKCGVPDPSWVEILHFVNFLNNQLKDCEESVFCDMNVVGDTLHGFRTFVVNFMLQMSQDFSTPSLNEEGTKVSVNDEVQRLVQFQIQARRRWEKSPHPYIFFNSDHNSMTFFGFYINKSGHLVDPGTSKVLKRNVMSSQLREGLRHNRVNFTAEPRSWTKEQKIQNICSVMGINQLEKVDDRWMLAETVYDPDSDYELTSDNMKKILAIHMRFRCNIPVVIMGETGCGKTRLIRYMCALQSGREKARNMLLVKVHGGTTYKDIEEKVRQAEELARENAEKNLDTVLFFDEANTTEALDMIKEVMVDRRVKGAKIGDGQGRLKFIAACNPYRRHTDKMIQRLESAGLGYRVSADKTEERLGKIPLRHLVYRVHALPDSMRPLIWDFGRLQHDTEELYIGQIVKRFVLKEKRILGDISIVNSVSRVLSASQHFMREQKNECSFVSLRDVERTMKVMAWFYEHHGDLEPLMERKASEMFSRAENPPLSRETRALVLAIGVCYHAKLQELRQDYRKKIAAEFSSPCDLPGGHEQLFIEITSCQRAVLDELKLGPNIARNTALSENVFMMVVCIELRIPLFVVGKPGSSKSLAKDVVNNNMQGDAAHSKLFKTFKEVHLASYQCSPLSTSEGIVATFKQCQKLQESKDLEKFVSVAVLDEVGLAEDSSRMPLKALHPLLEDGLLQSDDVIINTDEIPEARRVAFIGLSNWALDPAKMNRGIMLSRGVPETEELVDSAMGICSTDETVQNLVAPLLPSLAEGYSKLYEDQKEFETLKKYEKDEFFGLRDFYSLVKMVYSIAEDLQRKPRWQELELAIRRNFGGLEHSDPVAMFKQFFSEAEDSSEALSPLDLIRSSLGPQQTVTFRASRYLLILTENVAALRIIQQQVLRKEEDALVIFGSRFPKDQDYTKVCQNINRIKICMETGRMVILLNLDELYESLYDALNQYYVELGGQKYVDLGLGSHRLKCRVHDDFRLIVIAEKEEVYKDFHIPMINRLEKHLLVTFTGLNELQASTKEKLEQWVNEFATITKNHACEREFEVGDAFVGFQDDTVPAVVVQVWEDLEYQRKENGSVGDAEEEALELGKALLLQCATPDAVARLKYTELAWEAIDLWNKYFSQQKHSSLASCLAHLLKEEDPVLGKRRKDGLLLQITTYSRLLSNKDMKEVSKATGFARPNIECVTLQQFQAEHQFRVHLRNFLARLGGESGILVVQCDSGQKNSKLIACARHILLEEKENAPDLLDMQSTDPVHIAFIVQLPRIAGGSKNTVGFLGGKWITLHIDEMRPPEDEIPDIDNLVGKPISSLFDIGIIREEDSVISNPVALLRSCVQAAACRIVDGTGSVARATRRIELLLNLLPDISEEQINCLRDEGPLNFPVVLVNRVHQLLKEKEEKNLHTTNWIYSEALSGTIIHESGTFRKALWQRICNAITPILAEITALVDRDNNLDLIQNDDSWCSSIWLSVLNSSGLAEIHYEDLISPEQHKVRERTLVLCSGAGKHVFNCSFPFSWIIKQEIDAVWTEASHSKSQSHDHEQNMINSLQRLVNGSELGSCFNVIKEETTAALQYLEDFVHMVYSARSEEEHQLVCWAIEASAVELGYKLDEVGAVLLNIPVVHVAFGRLQKRLKNFSLLIQSEFGDQMIQILMKKLCGGQSQVIVDAVALQIYIELLQPSEEDLQESKTRNHWCQKLLRVRQTIDSMMEKSCFLEPTEDVATYGDRARQIITNCRFEWQRQCATRLFIEHVCQEDDGEQISEMHSRTAVMLWRALDGETDFSKLRSVQTVETIIERCCEMFQGMQERIADYRRRCTAFFMELVSLFCLGDNLVNSADPEVMSRLMCYVTGMQTTEETTFSPFLEQSPVVRSFLLQQLLRSSAKDVTIHLKRFLDEGRTLQSTPQQVLDVCVLFTQCKEDSIITRQARISDISLTARIKFLHTHCEKAAKIVLSKASNTDQLDVEDLESVAMSRYVLAEVASYLNRCYVEKDGIWSDLDVRKNLENLFKSAEKLCCNEETTCPKMFLLMQITKRFGMDSVKTLSQMEKFKWILPLAAQNEQATEVIPDRFIVFGNEYQQVREAVAKSVLSGDTGRISTTIEGLDVNDTCHCFLLMLSVYREVTLVNASPERKLDSKVLENILQILKDLQSVNEEAVEMTSMLLQNTQGADFVGMKVLPGQMSIERILAEIVVHAAIILLCADTGTLLKPLRLLLVDPTKLVGSYFPTMPHDDFDTIVHAVHKAMAKEYYKEGQWYECRNGHRYFIGECGMPVTEGRCPEPGCGAGIGGKSYQFADREGRITERENKTKTGYILGNPSDRSSGTAPERSMSSVVTCIVRLLLHSSLVMAACLRHKVLEELISPVVLLPDLPPFFWQHLQHDLDVLARSLGRSVDDAALTVHLVLRQMFIHCTGEATVADLSLKTEDGRKTWEATFAATVISPVLKELDKQLQIGLNLMHGDERLSRDPLMSALYEFDQKAEELTDDITITSRSLWRYRSRVTLEHLNHSFQQTVETNNTVPCKLLQEFLKKEQQLRALQFLPDIVRLQRILMDRFYRRMDRKEAEELSIKRFFKDLPNGEVKKELQSLFKSFKAAWSLVKKFLDKHGRFVLEKEFCEAAVDMEAPVAVLLPSKSGLGRCSKALSFYLVNLHNEFIGFYFNATNTDTSHVEHITVGEVTTSKLVAYDVEKDLMPMVLANCDYSLEVGKGTMVSYNWVRLERQLVDRLFAGRPFVDFKDESFAFSNDTRHGSVFRTLKERIPQESIENKVQKQIVKEVTSLSDVSTVLSSLEIAIGFLATAGGNKEMMLGTYLSETLLLPGERGLRSQTAEQRCQLKHIICLWRLMALQRAKTLTDHKQEPFEPMPDIFKKKPTQAETAKLSQALRKMNLNIFLPELMELIELKIKHEKQEVQDMEFAEYMQCHMDDEGADEIPGLEEFPSSICVEHVMTVWQVAVELSASWD